MKHAPSKLTSKVVEPILQMVFPILAIAGAGLIFAMKAAGMMAIDPLTDGHAENLKMLLWNLTLEFEISLMLFASGIAAMILWLRIHRFRQHHGRQPKTNHDLL